MPKRAHCPVCLYPMSVCVCAALELQQAPCKIIVLQHPSEAKHAKNTARLVRLGIQNCQITVGESATDFAALRDEVEANPQAFHLFYPSDISQPWEAQAHPDVLTKQASMLFIDATWRKALKLWHLNPWLATCRQWHFAEPPESTYEIRKTSVKNGLSTLEAVAHALDIGTDFDSANLRQLFVTMQAPHLINRRKA